MGQKDFQGIAERDVEILQWPWHNLSFGNETIQSSTEIHPVKNSKDGIPVTFETERSPR